MASRIAARRGAFVRNQAFWGVVAIVLLLAINVVKDPSYLSIGYSGGHLSGNLIDILRAAAPILMIAVGMCLVVATGGIADARGVAAALMLGASAAQIIFG